MVKSKIDTNNAKPKISPKGKDLQNATKMHGEVHSENQLAVLSHYLHDGEYHLDDENKQEIVHAIRDYIKSEKKNCRQQDNRRRNRECRRTPHRKQLILRLFLHTLSVSQDTVVYFHRPICRHGRFPFGNAGTRRQMRAFIGME